MCCRQQRLYVLPACAASTVPSRLCPTFISALVPCISLQAQSQTAALLRQELTAEQHAHEATRQEAARLAEHLKQVGAETRGRGLGDCAK